MSGHDEELTAYEPADRLGQEHGDIGARYERNPGGSYGRRSASNYDGSNLPSRFLDQAVSAGSSALSSYAEGWRASTAVLCGSGPPKVMTPA